RLDAMPITTWSFIGDPDHQRRMGPVAEDFYEAFGLGNVSTAIVVQDMAGVSLAAIKGLSRRWATLDSNATALEKRTTRLEAEAQEIRALRTQNQNLAERVQKLELLIAELMENRTGR